MLGISVFSEELFVSPRLYGYGALAKSDLALYIHLGVQQAVVYVMLSHITISFITYEGICSCLVGKIPQAPSQVSL